MPPFIFLTSDGQTTAPNLEDIDNLQVLGITNGHNSREAFNRLLQENAWIKESDYEEVLCLELKSERGEWLTIHHQ
ncbi:MAG: hypothetical protein BWY14_00409 [Parcubacteria group bacterium ADurb.Bin192]|nr:MAG: hypothetical protein BWY14_00409 [Parcubacteria group bacterium ADurb.Bin192]